MIDIASQQVAFVDLENLVFYLIFRLIKTLQDFLKINFRIFSESWSILENNIVDDGTIN